MNKENINKLVDWMNANHNYSTEELKRTAIEGGANEEEIREALNIINTKVGALEYKGVGIRFFAVVIDYIIIVIVFKILMSILVSLGVTQDPFNVLKNMDGSMNNLNKFNFYLNIAWFGKILVLILYYILMEWKLGATIGKLATGMRVRSINGGPISFKDSVIRNLMRIVDFLPVFYLVGAISIWNSKTKQRFGDRLAKTVVVSK